MFDLVWVATFKDSELPLYQYHADLNDPKGCIEVPFSQVLERQDDLVQFALMNRHTLVWYLVDLTKGTISVAQDAECATPKFLEPRTDMLRKDTLKYRLIYFREVTRSFDSHLQEVGAHSINYFIGFQYKDSEGHNQKRLMCVTADGRTVTN